MYDGYKNSNQPWKPYKIHDNFFKIAITLLQGFKDFKPMLKISYKIHGYCNDILKLV